MLKITLILNACLIKIYFVVNSFCLRMNLGLFGFFGTIFEIILGGMWSLFVFSILCGFTSLELIIYFVFVGHNLNLVNILIIKMILFYFLAFNLEQILYFLLNLNIVVIAKILGVIKNYFLIIYLLIFVIYFPYFFFFF